MSDLFEMAWEKLKKACENYLINVDDKCNGSKSIRNKDNKTIIKLIPKKNENYIKLGLSTELESVSPKGECDDKKGIYIKKFHGSEFKFYKIEDENKIDEVLNLYVKPFLNDIPKTEVNKNYKESEIINKLNQEIEEEISKHHCINKLYNFDCIDYGGKINDSKKYYSAVLAEELLKEDNLEKLREIETLTRDKSYFPGTDPHRRESWKPSTPRNEEMMAKLCINKEFKNKFNENIIGKCVDIQIPLKDKSYGCIDLVSIDKSKNVIHLLELKDPNNKETMLRCGLEIYTYWKQLDHDAFKKEIHEKFRIDAGDYRIEANPLICKDGYQAEKWNVLSKVRELMNKLGVVPYVYEYKTIDEKRAEEIMHEMGKDLDKSEKLYEQYEITEVNKLEV